MTHATLISESCAESPVVLTITKVTKHGEHYDIVGENAEGVSMKDMCVLANADRVPAVGDKYSFQKSESGHPVATFVEKA